MSLSTTGLILLSLISTLFHHLMKRRVIGSVLPTTKVTVSPGGSSLRILKGSSFILVFKVPSELQKTSILHHLQGRGPHFLFPFLILNNLQILCHLIPLMNQHRILSNLSTVSLVKMKIIQFTWPTLTFPIFSADPFFHKRYAKTSKRLIRAVKQSRIRQVRASARYQHGFQVPKDYNDAIRLDKENSNTHWQDAMDLELTQIHEYKIFKDTGKAQFHNGKVVTPDGFQKIRVHFVYAVKHDGRFKARLVADGHLTKEPVESIYSGVVSLRSLRMVVFLSQLNNLEIWGADVGNAHLEAYTDEKLCIIAGPKSK